MELIMTRLSKRAVTTLSLLYFCAFAEGKDSVVSEWNVSFQTEGQWNISGGKAGWVNLLEAGIDLELWDDGGMEVAALSSYATGTLVVDDVQGYSNLDAGEDKAFRLMKAGIGHTFDDKFYVFAGLRSMDEDYFNTPITSFFTGSSYGIFPVVSMEYEVPTFPLSALSLHVEYSPDDNWTVRESLYNGVASDRLGRQFRFCPASDGLLNIGSVTYAHEEDDDEMSPVYSLGYILEFGGGEGGVKSSYWANLEQPVAEIGESVVSVMLQGGYCQRAVEESRGYAAGALLVSDISKLDFSVGLAANRAFSVAGADETDVELMVDVPVWEYVSVQPAVHCVIGDGSCNVVGLLRVVFEIGG